MRRWLIPFVVLITVLIAVIVPAVDGAENDAILEDVSFAAGTDAEEQVVLKLNSPVDPNVFKIDGEKPRLVADLFDTRFAAGVKNKIVVNGQLVKGIRVGRHEKPPKTRVVLDLVASQQFSYKLDFEEEGTRIVITMQAVEQSADSTEQEPVKSRLQELSQQPDEESRDLVPEQRVSPPETKAETEGATEQEEQSELQAQSDISSTPDEQVADRVKQDETAELSSSAEETVERIIADIKDEKPVVTDPVLLDITFESTANDSEMVLFKLNDFYPPLVFGIEKGNPRVVCDFLDTTLGSDVRQTIQTKGVFVSRIRTALHPSPAKVRVVLDLVPNKNYDLQQVFFKEDNLFVIIINEFEKDTVNPLKTVPKAARTE